MSIRRKSHTDFFREDAAQSIGISSSELALDVASGTKTHFAEDPLDTPQVTADKYVTGAEFSSWERALDAAKSIVVHEIGHDPILRQFARRHFKTSAKVSVSATKEGQSKIDSMNLFYVSAAAPSCLLSLVADLDLELM